MNLSKEEKIEYNEETKEILELIIRKHTEELDLIASYSHYLVTGEIKVIKKETI